MKYYLVTKEQLQQIIKLPASELDDDSELINDLKQAEKLAAKKATDTSSVTNLLQFWELGDGKSYVVRLNIE